MSAETAAAAATKTKNASKFLILCVTVFVLFFQNKIILDPMTFSEARFRPSLEERLESIISGAALMADSSCTRDDRRERIVAECNAVRQALQDLLSEYMNNVSGILLFISFPAVDGWKRFLWMCSKVLNSGSDFSVVFKGPATVAQVETLALL